MLPLPIEGSRINAPPISAPCEIKMQEGSALIRGVVRTDTLLRPATSAIWMQPLPPVQTVKMLWLADAHLELCSRLIKMESIFSRWVLSSCCSVMRSTLAPNAEANYSKIRMQWRPRPRSGSYATASLSFFSYRCGSAIGKPHHHARLATPATVSNYSMRFIRFTLSLSSPIPPWR